MSVQAKFHLLPSVLHLPFHYFRQVTIISTPIWHRRVSWSPSDWHYQGVFPIFWTRLRSSLLLKYGGCGVHGCRKTSRELNRNLSKSLRSARSCTSLEPGMQLHLLTIHMVQHTVGSGSVQVVLGDVWLPWFLACLSIKYGTNGWIFRNERVVSMPSRIALQDDDELRWAEWGGMKWTPRHSQHETDQRWKCRLVNKAKVYRYIGVKAGWGKWIGRRNSGKWREMEWVRQRRRSVERNKISVAGLEN